MTTGVPRAVLQYWGLNPRPQSHQKSTPAHRAEVPVPSLLVSQGESKGLERVKDSLRVTKDICTSAELAPHLPDSQTADLHPDTSSLRKQERRVSLNFLSLQSLSSRGSGRKQYPWVITASSWFGCR